MKVQIIGKRDLNKTKRKREIFARRGINLCRAGKNWGGGNRMTALECARKLRIKIINN